MELCKYCNKPLFRNQKVVRAKEKIIAHKQLKEYQDCVDKLHEEET